MRSEESGEDVDGDSTPGETQQVQLKVHSGTNQYSFGPFWSPTSAATCMSGTGLAVEPLILNDASRLSVSNCTITGRVVYSGISMGGTPDVPSGSGLRSMTVFGYDPDLGPCTNCVTSTDPLGYFSLDVSVLSGVTLSALGDVNGVSGTGFSSAS